MEGQGGIATGVRCPKQTVEIWQAKVLTELIQFVQWLSMNVGPQTRLL